jgi:hypothetical protein
VRERGAHAYTAVKLQLRLRKFFFSKMPKMHTRSSIGIGIVNVAWFLIQNPNAKMNLKTFEDFQVLPVLRFFKFQYR